MRFAKGFTLLELMVTVSVLAILIALAAPALGEIIRKNRAQAEVSTIKTMFSYARTEAVQRATAVFVCTPNAGEWSVRLASCAGTELRRFDRPRVAATTLANVPQAGISFDARGYISNVAISANRPTYTLTVANECSLNRTVTIQPIGSVAISPGACI